MWVNIYSHTKCCNNNIGSIYELINLAFPKLILSVKDFKINLIERTASNENIEVISLNDISESMKNEVWQFESNKEDLINKPEEIKNKIVSGRVEKTLKTKVLLEQPFIRDSNITVEDYIKQTISILGENIKVRRFVRYVLGELDSL